MENKRKASGGKKAVKPITAGSGTIAERCSSCGEVLDVINKPFGTDQQKRCPRGCHLKKPWSTSGHGWGQ